MSTVIVRQVQSPTEALARRVILASTRVVVQEGHPDHLCEPVVYSSSTHAQAHSLSLELLAEPLGSRSCPEVLFESVLNATLDELLDGTLARSFEELWKIRASQLIAPYHQATDYALLTDLVTASQSCLTARVWLHAARASRDCIVTQGGLALVPLHGREYFRSGPRSLAAAPRTFCAPLGTPLDILTLALELLEARGAYSLDAQARALRAARHLA